MEPDFVAVRAAAPVTALVAHFHDGARLVFVVDGEAGWRGWCSRGGLLGLELGLQDAAA